MTKVVQANLAYILDCLQQAHTANVDNEICRKMTWNSINRTFDLCHHDDDDVRVVQVIRSSIGGVQSDYL